MRTHDELQRGTCAPTSHWKEGNCWYEGFESAGGWDVMPLMACQETPSSHAMWLADTPELYLQTVLVLVWENDVFFGAILP
jgi:hypothetical protein